MSLDAKGLPEDVWEQVDDHLLRRETLRAVLLYMSASGCGVQAAKEAVGDRYRERFPELWSSHRNVDEE